MRKLLCLLLLLISVTACVPVPDVYRTNKTSLELQAIQTRVFDTTKTVTFAAVLSVFQDLGYIVTASDIATGFITAKSPTQMYYEMAYATAKMKDSRSTAFIEEFVPGKTKVRLTFVSTEEWSRGIGQKLLQENLIDDPLIYSNAFTKIQEGIFIRSIKQ